MVLWCFGVPSEVRTYEILPGCSPYEAHDRGCVVALVMSCGETRRSSTLRIALFLYSDYRFLFSPPVLPLAFWAPVVTRVHHVPLVDALLRFLWRVGFNTKITQNICFRMGFELPIFRQPRRRSYQLNHWCEVVRTLPKKCYENAARYFVRRVTLGTTRMIPRCSIPSVSSQGYAYRSRIPEAPSRSRGRRDAVSGKCSRCHGKFGSSERRRGVDCCRQWEGGRCGDRHLLPPSVQLERLHREILFVEAGASNW